MLYTSNPTTVFFAKFIPSSPDAIPAKGLMIISPGRVELFVPAPEPLVMLFTLVQYPELSPIVPTSDTIAPLTETAPPAVRVCPSIT